MLWQNEKGAEMKQRTGMKRDWPRAAYCGIWLMDIGFVVDYFLPFCICLKISINNKIEFKNFNWNDGL